ncbi:MAG: hypothetical protein JNK85_11360 [Verrucomicrobiales bacterium]|nr:hypothetical protein [Verrucomicrobiales bacterium]
MLSKLGRSIWKFAAVGMVMTMVAVVDAGGATVKPATSIAAYPDGRPVARYRLDAEDEGPVLRHGSGPGGCDDLGARDVWVWESGGTYYMHYDGAGPRGWLACLATSTNLHTWTRRGPALDLGAKGQDDSASASYGVTFFDGKAWHMFYLGTPHTTPAPDYIPAFPYLTLKARGASAAGPWTKQAGVVPFRPKPGTYYSVTASPGHVLAHDGGYVMVFSASTDQPIWRTLALARTRDLDGPWEIDAKPMLPAAEQIENSSVYFDPESRTWWVFTNHVGLRDGLEYTDAIWVYWTKDFEHWNPDHKAVVLDSKNCRWSKHIVGLPSVVRRGNRLAIFYDGNAEATMPTGVKSHMNRDVGLAWLDLPLVTPPVH